MKSAEATFTEGSDTSTTANVSGNQLTFTGWDNVTVTSSWTTGSKATLEVTFTYNQGEGTSDEPMTFTYIAP